MPDACRDRAMDALKYAGAVVLVVFVVWGVASCVQKKPVSVQDIERMACQVATQKQIQYTATAAVCDSIMEEFHVKPSDCIPLLNKAWDAIAAQCPKGAVRLTPEEIERMACAVAPRRVIECRSTEEACKPISEHFPDVPPALCEGLLDKAWDAVVAHCPNATATAMTAALCGNTTAAQLPAIFI